MGLLKIRDRYVYITSKQEKGLRNALLQDMGPLQRMATKIYDSKASKEFDRRITIFLEHIYDSERELFINDWIQLFLVGNQATYELTFILEEWCSLRRGFSILDHRSFEDKFADDRSGRDRIYPLGQHITLASAPTPDYVKLLGWNPSVKVNIDCEDVQNICGEIDKSLSITLSTCIIDLTHELTVTPININDIEMPINPALP